jgi:hypothetical protein
MLQIHCTPVVLGLSHHVGAVFGHGAATPAPLASQVRHGRNKPCIKPTYMQPQPNILSHSSQGRRKPCTDSFTDTVSLRQGEEAYTWVTSRADLFSMRLRWLSSVLKSSCNSQLPSHATGLLRARVFNSGDKASAERPSQTGRWDSAVGHSFVLTPVVWSCTPAQGRTVPPPKERQEAAATKALCLAYPDLCRKGEKAVHAAIV